MSRQVVDILKDLCAFNPNKSFDRVPLSQQQNRYAILVGRVENRTHLNQLKDFIANRDEEYAVTVDQPNLIIMESEKFEFMLEFITLYEDIEEIAEQCRNRAVSQDHLNPAVMKMVQKNLSFEKFRSVCRFYEQNDGINVDKVMDEHDALVAKTHKYFVQKGLSIDEAKSIALALSFYTGTKYEVVHRGASLIARRGNGANLERSEDELQEAVVTLYYLIKAVSYIPYYWGYVTRACQLSDDELNMYTAGSLVTWIKFNSSKKGKNVANGDFERRNTFFKIYSLTGRFIKQFSNFPEEDEVLFLPHSSFIVFHHDIAWHGTQHTIYMRQIELGMSRWSVMWVDDRIFDENWQNKEYMERAAAKALNKNVHFIPKSSTDSALSFLRSPFGQRLKNQETFRIVTDMYRDNENPPHNAGARLIKSLRKMKFRNLCLVFAGDKQKTVEIIQSELNSKEQESIEVTVNYCDLEAFVNFENSDTIF
ncbi:hypothetical protein I4U23_005159 [Adineta vaga]|nr:hypothetical protein I4U23_005159 [Adineta vaga]